MNREEVKSALEESPLFHIIPPEDLENLIDHLVGISNPAPEYENEAS